MKRIEHKVGQRVVALTNSIDPSSQTRKKGGVYFVKAVSYCGGCGEQRINIGQATPAYSVIECVSDKCGFNQPTNGLMWTRSALFAPLDNLHESISEAEKNEDYELAQLLTEVMTENVELTELGL